MIDINKYMLDILQKERDYDTLGRCFRELKTVCESLVKSVLIPGLWLLCHLAVAVT